MYSLIRTIGAASTVLLKNTNGVLPLRAPKTIAIVGNGAGPSSRGLNGYKIPKVRDPVPDYVNQIYRPRW